MRVIVSPLPFSFVYIWCVNGTLDFFQAVEFSCVMCIFVLIATM